MCYYEKISFTCNHFEKRLIQHCHFARNDPNHQCFGAWNYKRERDDPSGRACEDCIRAQYWSNTSGTTQGSQSLHSLASGR
jgi:hypothetical protein